ncbi:MAG: ATP synthase F0 subunit B [Mogibacterium sp.]|nr:ATP synthase F0 subunit B [Mogibacterium sp.]
MTGIPLNIDFQQILLHLFNFTILFGALYILLYKPVKNFMENRESYYADMDSKAESNLKAAENTKAEYDDKIRGLDEEVRAEKNKARKEIEEMRERQLADARADAEKIVSDARNEANREKDEIIASAQKEITDMVTGAMEKLALEQSASDAFDQFLDAAEQKTGGHNE